MAKWANPLGKCILFSVVIRDTLLIRDFKKMRTNPKFQVGKSAAKSNPIIFFFFFFYCSLSRLR